MSSKLQSFYFDRIYLPVYDLTVSQIAPYRQLIDQCMSKLEVDEGHRVLSIGVGTGNEAVALLNGHGHPRSELVGVDVSRSGLRRTVRKVARARASIQTIQMDARVLAFSDEVFDRVVSIHTMDFVDDVDAATRELFRVLKPGGEYVVTFPSGKGGRGLASVIGQSVGRKMRSGQIAAAWRETFAAFGAGAVYLPLALTTEPPDQGYFNRESLVRLFTGMGLAGFHMDEDPNYQDFVVYGKK